MSFGGNFAPEKQLSKMVTKFLLYAVGISPKIDSKMMLSEISCFDYVFAPVFFVC